MHFYAKSIAQTKKILEVDDEGLSLDAVAARRAQHGENVMPSTRAPITKISIFFSQFKNMLMIILIISGVISFFLNEFIDMAVIFLTVAMNAIVGFFQENKANDALNKLNSMIKFQALVKRDGKKMRIDSKDVVPGDILFLEAGDKIQADGRIIDQSECEVNESALTGESNPIKKISDSLSGKVGLGDQKNMVFRGTILVSGRATVIVVATGRHTEIGKIATLVQETTDDQTPLQKGIQGMSRLLGIVVVSISAILVIAGLFLSDYPFVELFKLAVALSVAAIPEGLAISLTVILAIGMNAILKRNALVRKLVSAETLGSVSVICTDKTGTITRGVMSLDSIVTPHEKMKLTTLQTLDIDSRTVEFPEVCHTLRGAVLANDGVLQRQGEKSFFSGDTTDIAILDAAQTVSYTRDGLEQMMPRVQDLPFSSERMYMATLHVQGSQTVLYAKGAPEVVLKKCRSLYTKEKIRQATDADWNEIYARLDEMTSKGLRVLAVAMKDMSKNTVNDEDLHDLVFLGFIGLADPLRSDVADTLRITKMAGIKTIMITGDHVKTARYIGEQIGLASTDDDVFDGATLEEKTDEELKDIVQKAVIFARVDPIHKIRIVQALQANGEVVAMTGDGVNDAPAIKGADIGVALGSGTDVAKETADIVLLDDAFSTIVAAVEEGRTIYQNIRKVVLALLAGSFTSVILVVISLLFGFPLPLLAVQILWINIVQDGFPVMSLAFDKGDKENMIEPPRQKDQPILNKEMRIMMAAKSILANISFIGVFAYTWMTTQDIDFTRTIVFVALGVDALFFLFPVRSMRHYVWRTPVFDNKYLLLALLLGWSMLFLSVYWSPLQLLLRTVPLTAHHWLLMVLFGAINMLMVECVKGLFILRPRRYIKFQ